MRIGINALYMIPGGVGGTEIYLRSLIDGFATLESPHEFLVFINHETAGTLAPKSPQFQIIATGVRAVNRPKRLAWEQLAFPRELRKHRVDVLLNAGFTSPLRSPCPTVTVFHDLQHKRHPEYFRWFDLPFWQAFLWASARSSARIIAVSEPTRQDFLAHYGGDPSRVHVVHHGVDPAFFSLRNSAPPAADPYLLTVSTLHPHKNFGLLLEAYEQFAKQRPGLKLIIAGLRGFDAQRIESLITTLNLRDKVRCTGWIPRDDLYRLFAHADAFIYPTTFEGFGMTLLEAMAAALPVACSNIEPLRTLAGNAALLFDPHDTAAIVKALHRITADEALRDNLRLAGPQRAAAFRWEKTAELTLQVLQEAMDDNRP